MTVHDEPANVLIVDDRVENLEVLSRILENQGYRIRPCRGGKQACTTAIAMPPDLVLLDIEMPDLNGFDVCEFFKKEPTLREVPIIFLSAHSDVESKVAGFELGAVDFITKPFQAKEVIARVHTQVSLQRFRSQLSGQNKALQSMVDVQVREILSGRENLEKAHLAVIRAMSRVAEARDDETGQHIDRVAEYCRALTEALHASGRWDGQLTGEFIHNVYCASPLHDIGKVAIPDAVLFKPGKLTEDEFHVMRTHSEIGARTLDAVRREFPTIPLIAVAVDIARHHHEKWDGSGYPTGLGGEAIPLAARIMAFADVYDALRSKRCYKAAMGHERACEIIAHDSGTHFDPVIAPVFLEVQATMAQIHDRLNEVTPDAITANH